MGTPAPLSNKGKAASLLVRLSTPVEIQAVDLHPDLSLLLAGASSGDALIFATSTGGLVKRLSEPKSASAVTSVAWAEYDGAACVVVGHQSGSVRVWDVQREAVLASLPAHRADVGALATTPGLLATGSADTNIKLWSLAAPVNSPAAAGQQQPAQAPLQVLKGHAHPITRLQFSPDGSVLISGDAGGGVRVWQVDMGARGSLLHSLAGHHSGAIMGIACHPEFYLLFATGSADRTLRMWDMDVEGKCIGVHGPQGRREVRALAFTSPSRGSALLAAYPEGLRTFSVEPLEHQDTAELAWKHVTSLRYTKGNAIAVSLHKCDVSLFGVDLTRMKPLKSASGSAAPLAAGVVGAPAPQAAVSSRAGSAQASAEPSAEDAGRIKGVRFSDKYQVPAPSSSSAAPKPAPSALGAPLARAGNGARSEVSLPAGVQAAQPGARGQQQLGAPVLGPRAAGGNKEPSVQVFAPAVRPAQPGAFTASTPSGSAGQGAASGAEGPRVLTSGRVSPGADSRRGGRQRVSSEENGVLGGGSLASLSLGASQLAAAAKGAAGGRAAQAQAPADRPGSAVSAGSGPSMLELSSHPGFLASGLQQSRELCSSLQAKRGSWEAARAALERGDAREAVRLLRQAGDPGLTANVVESGALQRRPDRFTLELCTECSGLARQLLGSGSTRHHHAAVALVDAILGRWGGYVHDALGNAPRLGKVDLELERRQERSRALRDALLGLLPDLERLSVPPAGGRVQQLAARLKAL